jgi:hypothetical protein
VLVFKCTSIFPSFSVVKFVLTHLFSSAAIKRRLRFLRARGTALQRVISVPKLTCSFKDNCHVCISTGPTSRWRLPAAACVGAAGFRRSSALFTCHLASERWLPFLVASEKQRIRRPFSRSFFSWMLRSSHFWAIDSLRLASNHVRVSSTPMPSLLH